MPHRKHTPTDLEGNANENRFQFGNTANLNYLKDLQRNHPPATTQYVFGGDAWDFGHSDRRNAKRARYLRDKTTVNALVELVLPLTAWWNASCIGDAQRVQQNVSTFRRRNHVSKDISLVVLHGHRNYSIDTPLKNTVNSKNTVLFYDTSSWRIHSNKHPTCLWGKRSSLLHCMWSMWRVRA